MTKPKKWLSEPPEPPMRPPSDWYWFWEDGKNEPDVIEVWPGRYLKHYKGSWWSIAISRPTTKPRGKTRKKS